MSRSPQSLSCLEFGTFCKESDAGHFPVRARVCFPRVKHWAPIASCFCTFPDPLFRHQPRTRLHSLECVVGRALFLLVFPKSREVVPRALSTLMPDLGHWQAKTGKISPSPSEALSELGSCSVYMPARSSPGWFI